MEAAGKLTAFLADGIWRQRAAALPPLRARLLRLARVLVLASRRFWNDACPLRASALTFYALLALVPVAALALGIAKGFGLQQVLERELLQQLSSQQEVALWILRSAEALLENASSGLIAGMGVVLFLWSLLNMLQHIEASFNRIWEVNVARGLGRRLGDYLALVLAAMLLLAISGSATLVLTTRIATLAGGNVLLGMASPAVLTIVKLAPYPLSWILFTLVYRVMPNTRVPWSSACLAGVVAGSAYQVLQRLYFYFQVGATQYNAVYGSLAALPLFMFWLELSWSIVLFGAELSYAHLRAVEYELEPDPNSLSPAACKMVALSICCLVLQRFSRGDTPLPPSGIAALLLFPVRLVRQVSGQLVAAGLLSASCSGEEEAALLAARPPEAYSLGSVLSCLERLGRPADPAWAGDPVLEQAVTRLDATMLSRPENLRLLDLRQEIIAA